MATQNGLKTKTVIKTQFVKEIENMQKTVFSFYFSKINEHTFNLMNVSFNELAFEFKS